MRASDLQQLGHRFAVVEDVHRAAALVGEGDGGIDADGAVERGKNLRGRAAAVTRVFAAGAGGADGLAHFQSAARDHGGHAGGPVVAAAAVAVVDARGAAELAPADGDDVAFHAAVVQVLY